MTETRYDLVRQLRKELGSAEQTEVLIDYIQEMWETIDLLKKRFGEKRTQEIITIPSSFTEEYLSDDDN